MPFTYRLQILNHQSNTNIGLFPPGPAFYVKISFQSRDITIPAKMDTGSDFTTIPHSSAVALNLIQFDEQPLTGAFGGPPTKRPVFKADIEFLGLPPILNHPLVSLEKKEYMLIGRDVLNLYVTHLDGPNLQFDMTQ
jgi:hypothetical protein